ncbi:apolipoprotein N-acyltransferase [Deinococcus arenae]|uniref:Apolipoprotein N-acyltransferase n=1 Tax=Deinococcus arenae TaxID=1452751 RepID=A0A8H9GK53_9DEIO|nr:apolipoprotein N-acyltransferase [Deinococcus arenae]AWT35578.1 apolipoprotein N-acyltransferase [Deinococcus actinosclerus]GGM33674.1 apolipoprotein N-acyltransferase [Deinococcus arenae]
MPTPATGLLLGLLLAACGLPLPWSAAAFVPLALILPFIASAPTPRQAAGRGFWVGFGYFGLHLWWLGAFLQQLLGAAPLVLVLFALEGAFLAVTAFLAARVARTRTGRIWTLAGAWIILEWLRFLGPLAFPWPTLGYTLLPTPAIQIADLGGVLLGSVLVTFTAASLAHAWVGAQEQGRRPWAPALLAAVAWAAALGYGLTRTPGTGPEQPMRVMRVTFDVFRRATGELSTETQFEQTRAASLNRPPGSVVVWSETALTYPGAPDTRPDFPGPGISGAGFDFGTNPAEPLAEPREYNAAITLDATGRVTSRSDKTKLVPFGEEFPFQTILGPIYRAILTPLGFAIPDFRPNAHPTPLALNGVLYGAYICYDSVFPRVSRALAAQGAQLLVNPSNDGWYKGWGVQQHFNMGRVRAIETRRWLVRSVNNGVAGAVDDLGRPVQLVQSGDQLRTLDVRPRLLGGTTLYVRVGDWPALLLALGMIGFGVTRRERMF